jgi:hypothetical protein
MAAKKKAKTAPTPQTFFEVSVPRVLNIMRATCADLGGKYVVEVEGAGAWTLDFTKPGVTPGKVDNPDVTIGLSAPQFASLSTGKVELLKLVADGQARCDGDRAKVENISLILAFLERG